MFLHPMYMNRIGYELGNHIENWVHIKQEVSILESIQIGLVDTKMVLPVGHQVLSLIVYSAPHIAF